MTFATRCPTRIRTVLECATHRLEGIIKVMPVTHARGCEQLDELWRRLDSQRIVETWPSGLCLLGPERFVDHHPRRMPTPARGVESDSSGSSLLSDTGPASPIS
jgi:hypothetical protein